MTQCASLDVAGWFPGRAGAARRGDGDGTAGRGAPETAEPRTRVGFRAARARRDWSIDTTTNDRSPGRSPTIARLATDVYEKSRSADNKRGN
jgi:hypothetical protein